MAKLYSKKTKKSSRKKGDTSPLMADEPAPSSTSSSSRSERRGKMDKGSSSESKKKKKKSSKPKLSQEEQDAKDANLGCCTKFEQFVVKLVHVLDTLIGLTFLIYGSLIITQFENPAMEAAISTLTYGSTLAFASIMGIMGFYTTKCKRVGLVISAYMAPLIAFFNVFALIAVLSEPDTFFDYLTTNKDVLYLNDAEIQTLKNILPFFYITLASLTAIEICR